MENDDNERQAHNQQDRESIRAQLTGLEADTARLASRVRGPWWYHLALGVVVATIVASQALEGIPSIALVALAIIAIPLIVGVYQRRHGIWPAPGTGRATRLLQALLLGTVAAAFVAAVTLRILDSPEWIILVIAVAAAVAVVVAGRAYDRALEAELREAGAAGEVGGDHEA